MMTQLRRLWKRQTMGKM